MRYLHMGSWYKGVCFWPNNTSKKKILNESKFYLHTLSSSGVITKIVQGGVAQPCMLEG